MSEMPFAAPDGNIAEMTVSELAGLLRELVEESWGMIRVRGELGRVTHAASGHIYADLKDEHSLLNLVIWKSRAEKLGFMPEEGMEVIAEGRLSTYAGRSSYQLVTDILYQSGLGSLLLMLEERRLRLAAEGLFSIENKKPLPAYPGLVGVVTSPDGAVIRDIVHRISDRFPLPILLWPSRVQGSEAAAEIIAAIRGFNALSPGGEVPRPDILIIARGGGSVEDLWPFNDEGVVRAAAASLIPLVSAVGHETDTTLIDHAADVRAPTPSAAAEMIVPDRRELLLRLDQEAARSGQAMRSIWRRAQMRLAAISMPGADRLLQNMRLRSDSLCRRLDDGMQRIIAAYRIRLERLLSIFSMRAWRIDLRRRHENIASLSARLDRSCLMTLERKQERLRLLHNALEAVSHQEMLRRGYSMVLAMDGRPLRSAVAARAEPVLQMLFADGKLRARPEKAGSKTRNISTIRQEKLL